MLSILIASGRRIKTLFIVFLSRKILTVGPDLHIGSHCRLWAPDSISIGKSVYIGKDVTIECNASIGDYVLMANRVALVGRHDHEFRFAGVPVRFSPWIGAKKHTSQYRSEKVEIQTDVWIGYGAIILSGVKIERGAIVAAGSVVTKDISAYEIVAGNPAKKVGMRFTDINIIQEHEASLKSGHFESSERGYDFWTVEPSFVLKNVNNKKATE